MSKGMEVRKSPVVNLMCCWTTKCRAWGGRKLGWRALGGVQIQSPAWVSRTPQAHTHPMKDSCSSCRVSTGPWSLGIIRAIACFITICLLCSTRAETLLTSFIAVSPAPNPVLSTQEVINKYCRFPLKRRLPAERMQAHGLLGGLSK